MSNKAVASAYLACILSVAAPVARGGESANCQLKQYASLDLTHVHNGFYFVPVTVGGSNELMVLDTSQGITSLTEGSAKRLDIRVRSLPAGARVQSGTKKVDKMADLDRFSLGSIHFKKAEFLVVPDATLLNVGAQQAVGILAMDVLSNMDVELDFAESKMNLFSQDHCPGRVVYWSKTWDQVPIRIGALGEFYFPMDLDGKKLETTISTGNSVTTLHEDVTKKLFNFDSHSPDMESEADSSGNTRSYYRAMKISGDGIQVINANITLKGRELSRDCAIGYHLGAAGYEGCLGMHPLSLGRNVLEKLHIYISMKEKVLYFTPAAARHD